LSDADDYTGTDTRDLDSDGLTNDQETAALGTNKELADTDGDGLTMGRK